MRHHGADRHGGLACPRRTVYQRFPFSVNGDIIDVASITVAGQPVHLGAWSLTVPGYSVRIGDVMSVEFLGARRTEARGMMLHETERETYEQMWAVDAYAGHSPGEGLVSVFTEMAQRYGPETYAYARLEAVAPTRVLDAGAGSGKGALALHAAGYDVTLCDITPAGLSGDAQMLPFHAVSLWDDVRAVTGRHHYVYCCDVMEHIPPTFTMLVIRRLLDVAEHGVFLSISLVPDAFGAYVGKPLHQTVQSFTAWRDQLAALGDVLEARDLLTSGVYFVRPRC